MVMKDEEKRLTLSRAGHAIVGRSSRRTPVYK